MGHGLGRARPTPPWAANLRQRLRPRLRRLGRQICKRRGEQARATRRAERLYRLASGAGGGHAALLLRLRQARGNPAQQRTTLLSISVSVGDWAGGGEVCAREDGSEEGAGRKGEALRGAGAAACAGEICVARRSWLVGYGCMGGVCARVWLTIGTMLTFRLLSANDGSNARRRPGSRLRREAAWRLPCAAPAQSPHRPPPGSAGPGP